MFITYNQGNEQPQRIRHNIKLGLRQYTIAFDVHIVKEGENEQYKWCEITLPVGTPTYSQLVSAIIHGRYSDDAMQAIINNYLLEDEDSEHQKEWNDMQMWRVEAKRMAKEILRNSLSLLASTNTLFKGYSFEKVIYGNSSKIFYHTCIY